MLSDRVNGFWLQKLEGTHSSLVLCPSRNNSSTETRKALAVLRMTSLPANMPVRSLNPGASVIANEAPGVRGKLGRENSNCYSAGWRWKSWLSHAVIQSNLCGQTSICECVKVSGFIPGGTIHCETRETLAENQNRLCLQRICGYSTSLRYPDKIPRYLLKPSPV